MWSPRSRLQKMTSFPSLLPRFPTLCYRRAGCGRRFRPRHVEYAEAVESSLKATEFRSHFHPPSPASLADARTEGARLPFEAIFVRKAPELPPQCPAPKEHPPAPPSRAPLPSGSGAPRGPHATMCTNFVMPYAYLSALGYSVLHVRLPVSPPPNSPLRFPSLLCTC